jgi:hypothetical protein
MEFLAAAFGAEDLGGRVVVRALGTSGTPELRDFTATRSVVMMFDMQDVAAVRRMRSAARRARIVETA